MFWRGVLGYLPVNIVQGVVGLLTIVIFTRMLTPEQYGQYALAFSLVALVHTCLFTWLEAAMARFQPVEARDGGLPDHFASLYRIWAVMAVLLALITEASLFWPVAPGLRLALATGLGGTILRGLARLAQEHRRAAGRVAQAALIDIILTAGGFVAGVTLIAMGFGAAGPLTGLAIAAFPVLVWVLPSELRCAKGGRLDMDRIRSYARYGLPLAASLILALALSTTDRFLIAAFMDEASVGAYHAGYSLANRTLDVVFIWLGSAAGPAAIAALEHGGRTALDRTAREQASFMILLTLPAAIGLALVAKPLAELLIGEDLRTSAAAITPWIALSGLMSGLTTYYFHTAFTLGKATQKLLIAMSIPAAANVGLNLILIPIFGLMGAVWATAASYALGLLASALLGRSAIRLPIPWGAVWRCVAASAVMAVAVTLVPAWGGAPELIVKAGLGAAVYGAVALALNAGGIRHQSLRVFQALQTRIAR